MNAADAPLRVALEGGTLTLTLDRPEKRNALSAALIEALHAGLERADLDADVRVVVLRGAGQGLLRRRRPRRAARVGRPVAGRQRGRGASAGHAVRPDAAAAQAGRRRGAGARARRRRRAGHGVRPRHRGRRGAARLPRDPAGLRAGHGHDAPAPGGRREGGAGPGADRSGAHGAGGAGSSACSRGWCRMPTLEREARSLVAGLAAPSPSALALTKQLFYQLDGRSLDDGIALGARVNAAARADAGLPRGHRPVPRRGELERRFGSGWRSPASPWHCWPSLSRTTGSAGPPSPCCSARSSSACSSGGSRQCDPVTWPAYCPPLPCRRAVHGATGRTASLTGAFHLTRRSSMQGIARAVVAVGLGLGLHAANLHAQTPVRFGLGGGASIPSGSSSDGSEDRLERDRIGSIHAGDQPRGVPGRRVLQSDGFRRGRREGSRSSMGPPTWSIEFKTSAGEQVPALPDWRRWGLQRQGQTRCRAIALGDQVRNQCGRRLQLRAGQAPRSSSRAGSTTSS